MISTHFTCFDILQAKPFNCLAIFLDHHLGQINSCHMPLWSNYFGRGKKHCPSTSGNIEKVSSARNLCKSYKTASKMRKEARANLIIGRCSATEDASHCMFSLIYVRAVIGNLHFLPSRRSRLSST